MLLIPMLFDVVMSNMMFFRVQIAYQSGTLWYLGMIFSNVIIFCNEDIKMVAIERTRSQNDKDALP